MSDLPEICVVCAWRATCQKKFSISGSDMRCADFSRDVTLSKLTDNKDDTANNGNEG